MKIANRILWTLESKFPEGTSPLRFQFHFLADNIVLENIPSLSLKHTSHLPALLQIPLNRVEMTFYVVLHNKRVLELRVDVDILKTVVIRVKGL